MNEYKKKLFGLDRPLLRRRRLDVAVTVTVDRRGPLPLDGGLDGLMLVDDGGNNRAGSTVA